MPKEDNPQASDTSYNTYYGIKPSAADTNTEAADLGPMSPYYLYSTAEMSLILNKAEVTVRLEARRKGIGIRKDGRWWFNHEQRMALMEAFEKKRQPRGAVVSGDSISLPASIMQRQDFLAQVVRKLTQDRESGARAMWDMVNKVTGRFEGIEERLRKIERRLYGFRGSDEPGGSVGHDTGSGGGGGGTSEPKGGGALPGPGDDA